MKMIIKMIKENGPVSYFIIAVAVLIGLGSLSSFVNPEGIQENYVRNGQPKKAGVMVSVKKGREVAKKVAQRRKELGSFSESYFYKSKLLHFFNAQSIAETFEAFGDRTFKGLGKTNNGQISQEAYLSLAPHYLMITISKTEKTISVSATRQAAELNLERLKQLASSAEKTRNGIIYSLFEEGFSGIRYKHTAMETKMFGGHQVSWNISVAPN
jgi:hypothetical protein